MTSITGTKNTAAGWAALRTRRDALLSSCDWTQVTDSPLSASLKASWATYRQALRDLTKTAHIKDVVWPTPPSSTATS